MSKLAIRARGATHTGNVREANEDCLLVDPEVGLYAVLDGMGGAMAGDVAAQRARDVISEYVRARRQAMAPAELLQAAIGAASAAVHADAGQRRDRRGMGTTVVACLLIDERHAVIAHVGDSRAYLLREGRMSLLTRDHTVMAELLASGAISPEDALHHPYKSVLSRNLGAKAEARADLLDVTLQPGDRLLLCSDGLHGFAASEAVEQVLGGAESAEHASSDLIELALRGGGGDNVSVVVIEAGHAAVPRATQIVQANGSVAWWARRELFLRSASDLGLTRSPICAVLSPDEALEIVAGNLSEAIFHDLEQSTGVNTWIYAENLANGWLDQDGSYEALRDLLDVLRGAATAVLADMTAAGLGYAVMTEIAVTRSLVVAEMAVGAALAERLRGLEAELVAHYARARDEQQVFTEQATIPYMTAVRLDPLAPEVVACLEQALPLAHGLLSESGARRGAAGCVERVHRAALHGAVDTEVLGAARELYGGRTLEESGVAPLLDALDQARSSHLDAVKQTGFEAPVKAAALRRLATAHQKLCATVAALVVEAGHPVSDELSRAAEETARLRAEVGRGEAMLAELERKLVTRVDGWPAGGATQPRGDR